MNFMEKMKKISWFLLLQEIFSEFVGSVPWSWAQMLTHIIYLQWASPRVGMMGFLLGYTVTGKNVRMFGHSDFGPKNRSSSYSFHHHFTTIDVSLCSLFMFVLWL